MRAVGIKTLKNKLSEYVRAVAAGETVLITDRGRVVAELAPPRGSPPAPFDSPAWRELVRQGLVSLPARPLRGPPPRKPMMSFEELMEGLERDREDR